MRGSEIKDIVAADQHYCFDFESFFDKDTSLTTMGVEEYLNAIGDDVYLVSVTGPDGYEWVGDPLYFDWSILHDKVVCAHNARWDYAAFKHLQKLGKIPADVELGAVICTADLTTYSFNITDLKGAFEYWYDGEKMSKEYRNIAKGMGRKEFLVPEGYEVMATDPQRALFQGYVGLLREKLPTYELFERKLTSYDQRIAKAEKLGFEIDDLRTFAWLTVVLAGSSDAVASRRLCKDLLPDWPDMEMILSQMTREGGMRGVHMNRELIKEQKELCAKVRNFVADKFPWKVAWVKHKFEQASVRKYLRKQFALQGMEYPGNNPDVLYNTFRTWGPNPPEWAKEIKRAINNVSFFSDSEFGQVWRNAAWKQLTVASLVTTECEVSGIPVPNSMNKDDELFQEWLEEYGPKYEWVDALRMWNNANACGKVLDKADVRSDNEESVMKFGLKYGAAHTMRWGGTHKYNMQNMLKVYRQYAPTALTHEIRAFLGLPKDPPKAMKGNYHPLASVDMRGIHTPRPGHKFIIGDQGQIEPRVKAWLAKDWEFLEACKLTHPYLASAVKRGAWDLKDGDVDYVKEHHKSMYDSFKASELSLQYGTGCLMFVTMCNSFGIDPYAAIGSDASPDMLDELADYLEFMVKRPQSKDQVKRIQGYAVSDPKRYALYACSLKTVREWRANNKPTTDLWALLADSMRKTAKSGRSLGILTFSPDPRVAPSLQFSAKGSEWGPEAPEFRIHLPSGSDLRYYNVRCSGNKDNANGLSSRQSPGDPKKYPRLGTHPGKLCENIVQKLSRDVFGWQLVQLYNELIPFTWLVHDETIDEVKDEEAERVMERIRYWLTQAPPWMPDLPLSCDIGMFDKYEKG